MDRKGFLLSSAMVVATPGTGEARSVPGGTHPVERRADFDERAFVEVVDRPAQIRQLYEAVAFSPGVLGSVTNSFNGLQFGFGYAPRAISVAFAGHGASAAYGYSDYVWKKYRIGEFFTLTDEKGTSISSNIFWGSRVPFVPTADPDDPSTMYHDSSIQTLQRRGLILLTCHTAVEEQAKAIVKKGFAPANMMPTDVADDILTHLVPGALVVPSMVATIAVLQATYRYTYVKPL